MKKHICVFDPAVKEPATPCFNRMTASYPSLRFSYHLPAIMGLKTLEHVDRPDAVLILGSAAFVSDEAPWQKELWSRVHDLLQGGVPTLGLCFGHQLVAKGFGATVDYIETDHRRLAGVREIEFTSAVGGIERGSRLSITVNHRQEIKGIPSCLDLVATSEGCRFEGIRHRELAFWGFQGHAEASPYFLTEYIGGIHPAAMHDALGGGSRILDAFFHFANISETPK